MAAIEVGVLPRKHGFCHVAEWEHMEHRFFLRASYFCHGKNETADDSPTVTLAEAGPDGEPCGGRVPPFWRK